MTTPLRRFAQALAAVVLSNGLLYLCLCEHIQAADKEAEAKKYTETLKKGKTAKEKTEALQELGKLAQVQKSLVADALPDIYKALEDKDAGVRAAAAHTLGQCDEPADKAVPLLVKILKDDRNEDAKIGAAKGLAAMGPGAKSALGDLRSVIKDSDKKSKLAKAAQQAVKSINASSK
jgi:HEAT repeat protein